MFTGGLGQHFFATGEQRRHGGIRSQIDLSTNRDRRTLVGLKPARKEDGERRDPNSDVSPEAGTNSVTTGLCRQMSCHAYTKARSMSVRELEQVYRATEAFAADSGCVPVPELAGLWAGKVPPRNGSVWRQE